MLNSTYEQKPTVYKKSPALQTEAEINLILI